MMLGDTLYDAGRYTVYAGRCIHCMMLGDTLYDAGRYTV